MRTKEKGLQKLTDIEKANDLFKLKQITRDDFDTLSEAAKEIFIANVNGKINQTKGLEKDKFITQIEPIIDPRTKNEIWEINHNSITWAISTLMQEYGRMPSKREIALNYMGTQNWHLVNAFPLTTGGAGCKVLHFYFRKEYDASELAPETKK